MVVTCPAAQQSAQSHAITVFKPLWAEPYTLKGEFPLHIPAWRVSGTPTDCIKVALTSNLLQEWHPDLVVSGINAGSNSGLNVIYSGTCAAALEACIYDIPSIALSLDDPHSGGFWHFAQSAALAVPIIDQVLFDQSHTGAWTNLCCNVNFPNIPQKDLKGYKLVRQGTSRFTDFYVEKPLTEDEKKLYPNRRQFRLEGAFVMKDDGEEWDSYALKAGWITITPISCSNENGACRALADKIKSWPCFQTSTTNQ